MSRSIYELVSAARRAFERAADREDPDRERAMIEYGRRVGDLGRLGAGDAPAVRALLEETAPRLDKLPLPSWLRALALATEPATSDDDDYRAALTFRSDVEFWKDFYRDLAPDEVEQVDTADADEALEALAKNYHVSEVPADIPTSHVWWHRHDADEAKVARERAAGATPATATPAPGIITKPALDPWVEIVGGRFVVGLRPDEVETLVQASAQAARERVERDPDAGFREAREVEEKTGNVDYLRPLIARAFAAREVELAPFAIARTPVTNGEWKRFLAATKLLPPDRWSVPGGDADERAVIGVSWEEASQYAAWIGAALPTEVQWERAARGLERRFFPWGNAWGERGAWLDTQPFYDPWPRSTHPELASPDGVHDLITRRWEWCADAFTGDDEALGALYPALRPDGRVRRGGDGALVACAIARTGTRPSWRADGTGFRVVRAKP